MQPLIRALSPSDASMLDAVLPPAGSVRYVSSWLDARASERLFEQLRDGLNWRQMPVRLFGRRIPQPRLVDFHADPGTVYTYSGLRLQGQGWPRLLHQLCKAASVEAGVAFNSVLCNLYRDGRDYMGWHADDERVLGPSPSIASVSLGAERRFLLRPRRTPREPRHELILESGSLLLMAGDLQHHWHHQLPKALRVRQARINLTFRKILDGPQ